MHAYAVSVAHYTVWCTQVYMYVLYILLAKWQFWSTHTHELCHYHDLCTSASLVKEACWLSVTRECTPWLL